MSCTAEEIAAKKRIAQERLRAKQQQLQNATNISPSTSSNSVSECSKNYRDTLKAKNPFSYNSRLSSQPYAPPVRSSQAKPDNIAPIFVKVITCTCAMLTDSRFTVVPSGFHKILIDTFKAIPSKQYDVTTRGWSFSLSDYQLVQERVQMITDVSIGQIPKFVLNLLKKPSNNHDQYGAACFSVIEPILVEALLHFQKEGVAFGISKQGRCMIADEMGLGKTYQALALADFYRDDWPLLVCTTAGTRDSWASKVRELLPSVPCHLTVCMTTAQDYVGDAKVLIVSYNLMERSCDKLLERKFGVVILDESHLLKNVKAKSSAAAAQFAKQAKRVILLTGTPALSRPSELFTQLQIIDPYFFGFKEYSVRYCAGKQNTFGWDSSGQSNLSELNIVLNKKFMIRRTKQQVYKELADKARETVMLDPALVWQSDETRENMESYATDYSKLKGREREEILLRYYSETGRAKTKAVCAYVKNMLKMKHKFIIFAHHKVMLNAISECVSKLNVDYIRIDGNTRNDQRTIFVDRFQAKSNCRVAVLSLKACNAGITLTAAQLVLFAELDWNPSTMAQAESRAHRIGQEGIVTCQYLLARGTADDLIWQMLKNKQNVLNQAGLFNDDLANGTCSMAPVSGESIEKYIVKTPRKSEEVATEPAATANIETHAACGGIPDIDIIGLLDGDEDDFVNLEY